ncbi:MAG: DUF58 domain-containing protein [Bacteroidales bacterium]|nr:DUF58 domain-containing protein [Bacteroidales bacterium]
MRERVVHIAKQAWQLFKDNRRRVFKIVLIILAVAACCIPPIYVNNAIGYIPLIVLVLAIILSYLYLLFLQIGLEFEEASRTPECTRGASMDFVLRLRNKSFLVYPRIEVVFHQSDLFGEDMRSESTDITLSPFAKRDFTFSMYFEHVGRYQAGLKKVVLHDIIGLFSKVYENEDLQTIEVLPRLHELTDITFDSEAPTASTAALKTILNEGVDYSQVREYMWGDPIKAIHWKVSARFTTYMTRIYETNTNPGLTTVIDLHAPEDAKGEQLMSLFDGVIESALSVDAFGRAQGLDCELMYANEYGEQKRYAARLQAEALHELTGLLRKDTSCFAGEANEIIEKELNSPYAQSNIAVCTSDLGSGILDLLLATKQRRRNPILFFVIPPGLSPLQRRDALEPLRRLDGSGIIYFAFSGVDELTEGGEEK